MTYSVDYTDKAIEGLNRLRESEPKAYAKAKQLIEELNKLIDDVFAGKKIRIKRIK